MSDLLEAAREQVIYGMKELIKRGLNHEGAGNVSVRIKPYIAISPTNRDPHELTPADIPIISTSYDGNWSDPKKDRPSSEWPFHCQILRERAEVSAVVHCHSKKVMALAATPPGIIYGIPAVHYMVGEMGGANIRCASWAIPGTNALAKNAVEAIRWRTACILANHGQITIGRTVEEALDFASKVETAAGVFLDALPSLLACVGGNVDKLNEYFIPEPDMKELIVAYHKRRKK
jgi:L-fuculose-phosphate aldolase